MIWCVGLSMLLRVLATILLLTSTFAPVAKTSCRCAVCGVLFAGTGAAVAGLAAGRVTGTGRETAAGTGEEATAQHNLLQPAACLCSWLKHSLIHVCGNSSDTVMGS